MTWCTEGLPDPYMSTLVTVVEPDNIPSVFVAYHDGEAWIAVNGFSGPLDDYVTAWMPTPAPYGGGK